MNRTVTVPVQGEYVVQEYGPPAPVKPLSEAEARARGQAMVERWLLRDIAQYALNFPLTASGILDEWNRAHKLSFDSLCRMRAMSRHSKRHRMECYRIED